MKRILIFGDSIMRGVYYSAEAGRHKLWGERLSALKEKGIEVKNCSVMGATVSTGLELMRRKLTDPASDTTVLFEYGGNDCDHNWQAISEDPSGEYTPNTPRDIFVSRYREAIGYAKKLGASVMMCNLIPLDAEKYMSWISRGRSQENIIKWLGDESMLYRWHEYYNRTAEQIATDCGCPLIDLRSEFLLSHGYGKLLSEDGIHPTAEGHELIDRLLIKGIFPRENPS